MTVGFRAVSAPRPAAHAQRARACHLHRGGGAGGRGNPRPPGVMSPLVHHPGPPDDLLTPKIAPTSGRRPSRVTVSNASPACGSDACRRRVLQMHRRERSGENKIECKIAIRPVGQSQSGSGCYVRGETHRTVSNPGPGSRPAVPQVRPAARNPASGFMVRDPRRVSSSCSGLSDPRSLPVYD
jgi:hypothetical protein